MKTRFKLRVRKEKQNKIDDEIKLKNKSKQDKLKKYNKKVNLKRNDTKIKSSKNSRKINKQLIIADLTKNNTNIIEEISENTQNNLTNLNNINNNNKNDLTNQSIQNNIKNKISVKKERKERKKTSIAKKFLIDSNNIANKNFKKDSFNFEIKNESKICVICFDEIIKKQEQVYIKCGHFYHKTCIDKWLTTSNLCPICKGSIFLRENSLSTLNTIFQQANLDSDSDIEIYEVNNEDNPIQNRNTNMEFINDTSQLNMILMNRLFLNTYRNRLLIQEHELNYTYCEFFLELLFDVMRKCILRIQNFINNHPVYIFSITFLVFCLFGYYLNFLKIDGSLENFREVISTHMSIF